MTVSVEEKGLLGSSWYADHPLFPIENTVANINIDMIGRNWRDTVVAIGREESTLGETLERVVEDHAELALEMIDQVGEKNLADQMIAAPWNPQPLPMGVQFASMIGHLETHKTQLFYYLKLQGKPVHTGNLYGMG